ncbi:hypothetical protein SAM23877_7607 [Streptomyces ambofaciens ATCC 23877]|uniref:Uncharacterized protein n=1 Tax=Streptomyces ambofaciens (strain ATCC 23877 / 3486 / DSM 40053 / JCM 4204 / NBRC 12836 / NRRL B-2516) TaxID=278992 RepID=A0A0K2AJE6_STRA7|nr:hypothetical protein SAM23877_0065 [Streptomyces ambofaciens ATCC 23877]AKZ60648.1 hypothetical protein SAM23877_7607 [Streptomyces ambofaciens ATCC 23877]
MTASTTTPPSSPSASPPPPLKPKPPNEPAEDHHPPRHIRTCCGLSGDLDHATAGELRELTTTLTLQPGQRLVFDLTGL